MHRIRRALQELVTLKDMALKAQSHSLPEQRRTRAIMLAEYEGRRPAAWKEARLALASDEDKRIALGHQRYEIVRTLSPRAFALLYQDSIAGNGTFDEMVDAAGMRGKEAPDGLRG